MVASVGRERVRAGPRFEVGNKRVRPMLGGAAVADSLAPLLVWEGRRAPEPLRDAVRFGWDAMDEWLEESVHPNVVWMYRTPLPEVQKIAGLACFYNELCDISIEGVLQERPPTPFSR